MLDCIPNDSAKIVDFCTGTGTCAIGIAQKKQKVTILGIDRSKSMLSLARHKVNESDVANVKLRYADVTQTGLKSESVDAVMISLVLHEVPEEVRKQIIEEAYRILKKDGTLFITEWEQPKELLEKICFLPMYVLEPKGFTEFLHRDLNQYMTEFGFVPYQMYHCDYSKVNLFIKK